MKELIVDVGFRSVKPSGIATFQIIWSAHRRNIRLIFGLYRDFRVSVVFTEF